MEALRPLRRVMYPAGSEAHMAARNREEVKRDRVGLLNSQSAGQHVERMVGEEVRGRLRS